MLEIKKSSCLYNSLEPQSLVDCFLEHPPENFTIKNINLATGAVYGFLADLFLLLTVDSKLAEFINNSAFFKPLRRLLTQSVYFIGTTVSEYSLFPDSLDLDDFTRSLLSEFKKLNKQLLIVKDLPANSPLLSKDENKFAESLISHLEDNNFIIMSGQALAYVPINFCSIEEYLKRFTSNRRNNFKRKIKRRKQISLSAYDTRDSIFTDENIRVLYGLYLNVYENSDIHFDKLTFEFFKDVFQKTNDGKVFIYKANDKIIGFCLCYIAGDYLVDKYRGYQYPDCLDYYLYFNQFFDNLEYCIKNNLNTYIIGWTAAKIKAYLGCGFTQTYHAIYVKNPILRLILKQFKSNFESDEKIIQKAG